MKTLRELGVKIYSGKIVQRLIADPVHGDEIVGLVVKAITKTKTLDVLRNAQ